MRVLALGAHPDDIEMGCGSTLHKFMIHDKVKAIVFSDCSDAVPEGWKKDSLTLECEKAMRVLGVSNLEVLDHENTNLAARRQGILERLYQERDWPDIVLVCSTFNSHQDHRVVTEEAMRAFRGKAIYGYALPHSDYGFATEAVYSLVSEDDVDAKVHALQEYRSQFELKRAYFDLPYLKAIMRTAGGEIGKTWAEKFQNIRGMI